MVVKYTYVTYTWQPRTRDKHIQLAATYTGPTGSHNTDNHHHHHITTLRSGRRGATAPHATHHDTDETHFTEYSKSRPNKTRYT
ncbi:hypothetical protein E2C01_034999 [Portunus trituberculatus]|uniref:Uncharacterized protein n=1 Tax=Portunus trituberculatus TaxID=210409 RepID=A0A5B7F853_PORTR|nr:hypothetical protein [Portunus trituberculatus]